MVAGKHFTQALSRLFTAYANKTPLEHVALRAAAILGPLLLQKVAVKSTYKENVKHLERRLEMWRKGEIRELVAEAETIQSRLSSSQKVQLDEGAVAKRFANMVFHGNLKKAMRMITEKAKGVLPLNDETKKDFAKKHPKAELPHPDILLKGEMPPDTNPIVFNAITGGAIKDVILHTEGAALSWMILRGEKWRALSKNRQ